jgi:hypothetical protein
MGWATENSMEPLRSDDPLIARAVELNQEVDRFKRRWPPMSATDPGLSVRWEEFERQLVDLAPSDLQAELVHRLVARTRAYAALKPPEMVLRELLCIAALVLEPDGEPSETAS